MFGARGQRKAFIGVCAAIAIAALTSGASAGDSVTFTATQTIPVPPASSFVGPGSGDGWNLALTPTAEYNVFHHRAELVVACELQENAQPCWPDDAGHPNVVATRTIRQPLADNQYTDFATSGHSGVWIDQKTGKLYMFATRESDSSTGVVCVDTNAAAASSNPFCGFTDLTGPEHGRYDGSGSYVSNFATVGARMFAFNFASGTGVGETAENKLLCFDTGTLAGCSGQPFTMALGQGSVSVGNYPPPSVAAIGNQVIVPITVGGNEELACIRGDSLGSCGDSWPVGLDLGYPSGAGSPFPRLDGSGALVGLCLPISTIPCFTLAGRSADPPPGIGQAISPTSGWNGSSVLVGQRVYVPNGNTNAVDCYDYGVSKPCANFPKSFAYPATHTVSLLYTVNADPQRPECLWINSDTGTRIQNFDAFTGGACGVGAIRILASSFVVTTPECTPGSWDTLQITSPARSSYTSGSVSFQDGSGAPIPGASDVQLDNTGTAELAGLNLGAGVGLPQFLITLNRAQEAAAPTQVVVKVAWTGTFDPACATKPGTTIVNQPTAGPPASANAGLSLSAPRYGRTGGALTFRAVVKNAGPDTSTGLAAHFTIPTGAIVDSASTDIGAGCAKGSTVTCYIGTLSAGSSANITLVLRDPNTGSLSVSGSLDADHDSDSSNNASSAATTVIGQNDPPPAPAPPSDKGTFTALTTGTVLVNGVAVPADQPVLLKSGDVVDVSGGAITVASQQGWVGTFSDQKQPRPRTLSSWAGRAADNAVPASFTMTQSSTVDEPVTIALQGGDFTQCNSPRSLAAKPKPVRAIWGSAKGSFKTTGRYSAATIRGTIWFTEDRCDGTFTSVDEGVVDVADASLKKTVTLSAGQSYLAKPPTAAKKPPTQKRTKRTKKATKRKKAAPKQLFYVVEPGDSVSAIATAKLGEEKRWVDIVRLNKLTSPYTLQPGTRLKLPKR